MYSINSFFNEYKRDGKIQKIHLAYNEHLLGFDYVDIRYYLKRIDKKLPKYEKYFKKAAKHSGIDIRILAAVSYQESHWDRKSTVTHGCKRYDDVNTRYG